MKRLLIASSEKVSDFPLGETANRFGIDSGGYDEVIILSNANDRVVRASKWMANNYGKGRARVPKKDRRQTANAYREMIVKLIDVAVIFWDGKSRGTQQLVDMVERKGIPFMLVMV